MKKSTFLISTALGLTLILCSFKILTHNSCGTGSVDPKGGNSTLSSGGIDGAAGSPKDIINWGGTGYCADCHGSSSTGVSITINASPSFSTGYIPGQVYSMSVTVVKSAINYYGFNFEAQTTSNTNAGDFAVTAAGTKTFATLGTLNMSHSAKANGTNGYTFTFNWIAPASATTGVVTLYAAGVAANNNNNDTGDFTAKTSISLAPVPSGVNEISESNSLSIYPNPASNKFTVSFSKPIQNPVLKLFSIDGKEVNDLNYVATENKAEVSISSLTKGIYFVKVYSNGKEISKKLIVQ